MLTRASFLRGVALSLPMVGLPMLATAPAAWALSDQQTVIEDARKTLRDLRHDKAFGNARTLLHQARAVLVFPKLIKGGFILGGEGGEGVLMVRGAAGWSDPAFYAMGSASLGLQAGLQQAEVIMLVMTAKGVQGLLSNEFKIGASAGISVVTLGSGVEGAIGGASPPDIVLWSSSTGLYGGLTIDGSIIRPQPDDDRAFYGRPVSTRDVLYAHTPSDRGAALRRELGSLG